MILFEVTILTAHQFQRIVGYAEGTSFLLLLGIAMPLKYLAHIPEPVLVVGWLHGLLFMLFWLAIAIVWFVDRWPILWVALGLLSSIVPFGPFLFEWWLRRRVKPSID